MTMKTKGIKLTLLAVVICAVLALSACNGEHTHTPGEWIIDTEPTCAAAGAKHTVCTECGEVVAIESVPTVEHFNEADEWITVWPATCVAEGSEARNCTKCNAYTAYNKVAPLGPDAGHSYQDRICTYCSNKKPSEGLAYTDNGDGTCYVSGIGACTDTDIVIPATSPDGKRVTGIGEQAFAYCRSLTSATIPDSVTSIGDWAFYGCSSLASVTISDSVTSIGEVAFYDCSNLTSVTIPNSVTSIGVATFSSCSSLTSITVDSNNTAYMSIDGNLYSWDGKTLIQYAIGKASTSFTIPNGVTSIGYDAFHNCSNLTSVTIPDSVTRIGDSAFAYCRSITSVTIPDSVTSIGYGAFLNCTSLTSVTIGDGVMSIGNWAFSGCSILKSITVDSNNTAYKSIDGNLYSWDGKTLIQYAIGKTATSFTIPDGVTSIGHNAFFYCKSLTSVTIPDGVTSIGDEAFYNCSSLTSVTIGDGVTSIGDYAFAYCSSLTSVTIPDSLTSIGDSAFAGCVSLASVTFENTSGWWCTKDESATSGTSIPSEDLSDPAKAAEYLRSTYYDYYWKRS